VTQRLSYYEIDLEVCELTHGEGLCPATGEPCFNTRKTCQAIEAYSPTTQVLRLGKPSMHNPGGIDAVENVADSSYTPSIVKLGESIGTRASLKITATDHPSPDTGAGGDPYLGQRNYDPFERGTFWGKLRARHPYMRGNKLRWYNGRVGQSLEQMERRTYIIDSAEGPNTRGQFMIKAKDPLTLTESKRAQAPKLSRGVLGSALSETATSFIVSPAGVGADYPTSGKVAIGGNEIVSYTRSGDTFTISRGINNTEIKEHDEGDRVQWVLEYSSQEPENVLFDLLTNYAQVPAEFINMPNWTAELNQFLGRRYSGVIAEPTPVIDLINELLEQAALSIWWDEIGETLQLQVLRNVTKGSFVYNDDFMLAGSFKQREQPDKRVSQVWTYYGQINPLESQDDPKNYRNTLLTVNQASELNWGEPAVKKVYSRWMTQFALSAAERLNTLVLSRFAEPPRMFEFNLLRDSGTPLPPLGSGLQLQSFFNQDPTGAPVTSPCQAIEVKVSDVGVGVKAEEVVINGVDDGGTPPEPPDVKRVVISADATNVNLREAYLNIFSEAEDGDTVICEVRENVIVTSETTSAPAFDTGTGWPSGVSLKLSVLSGAVIAGRGGAGGGSYSDVFNAYAYDGGNGGLALLSPSSISIDNNGIIGGGGGGGGGATFDLRVLGQTYALAAGGGGGASYADGGSADLSGSGNLLERSGSQGSLLAGGDGGNSNYGSAYARGGIGGGLGQSGGDGQTSLKPVSSGGAAGPAIQGVSNVTFISRGDIRGAEIG